MSSPPKDSQILILGAGLFGLTLALELCKRQYTSITILDRHLPPVLDSSSADISRVIRSEYADAAYAKMALEAVAKWEQTPFYHQSGIMLVADEGGHPYLVEAKRQTQEQGGEIKIFENVHGIREAHPEFAHGTLAAVEGYTSPRAGWAPSSDAIDQLAAQCSAAGASFITGPRGTVTSLLMDDTGKRITGVKEKSGSSIYADHIVLATGAWTARLFDMSSAATSTGQPVGYVQLTPQESQSLRQMPITIHLDSGFFVFPPTPDTNLLKCAVHGNGYETRVGGITPQGEKQDISAPAIHGDGTRTSFLPADAEKSLLEGLCRFLPSSIAERGFVKKHLCWYTTTLDSDFIVDYHPQYYNLFFATGGSGHAFKFLPVLGKYTADVFQGTADKSLKEKWAWKAGENLGHGDASKGGAPGRVLDEGEQRQFLRGDDSML